ncbi:MAG: alanyl-tRNA editing protein [Lachnospiraceae bacterium]|nr:alanyl-tRNA editing protein [Lachnospiraceae bacterium]
MKNERNKNDRTELLYETDGGLTDFEAVVIESLVSDETKEPCIVLDRTAFFPEGGGQPSDVGSIVLQSGETVRVTDVRTVDGCVCHFIEKKVEAGEKITGHVDAARRLRMMQDHGAEHLVCGLIHNEFGYDNVGFHMSEKEVVVDVSGPLTDEQIRMIEERANAVVYSNVPVTISFPSPEEAASMEYRSKLDVSENVRLVTIEGVDTCACCAPHVSFTGQLGVIKILSFMPHRGGTRMTVVAGLDAYADYVMLHDSNAKIMDVLSSPRDDTGSAVSEQMERYMALKEENTALRKEMAEMVASSVLERIRTMDPGEKSCVIFTASLDQIGLRNVVNRCTAEFDGYVCAFSGDNSGYRYIFAVSPDMEKSADLRGFTKEFNEITGGRGGGSALMTTGQTPAGRDEIQNCVDKLCKKA